MKEEIGNIVAKSKSSKHNAECELNPGGGHSKKKNHPFSA